ETSTALGCALRAGGWRGSGAGSDGDRAAKFGERDAECFASFGCPDRGNLLGRSPPRLQWFAFETRGTDLGRVRCHSIWHAQAAVRGSSFRQRRVPGGISVVLRPDLNPDSAADAIGPRPVLISAIPVKRASEPAVLSRGDVCSYRVSRSCKSASTEKAKTPRRMRSNRWLLCLELCLCQRPAVVCQPHCRSAAGKSLLRSGAGLPVRH